MNNPEKPDSSEILVNQEILMELIFWARRYCDQRATYAPSRFNNIYKAIRSKYPDMIRCHDEFDSTLMQKGKFWPYAQDGMYDEKTKSYDATK